MLLTFLSLANVNDTQTQDLKGDRILIILVKLPEEALAPLLSKWSAAVK